MTFIFLQLWPPLLVLRPREAVWNHLVHGNCHQPGTKLKASVSAPGSRKHLFKILTTSLSRGMEKPIWSLDFVCNNNQKFVISILFCKLQRIKLFQLPQITHNVLLREKSYAQDFFKFKIHSSDFFSLICLIKSYF